MSEGSGTIRVLLVDDHTLFRESLHRLLDAEVGFAVCGDFAAAEAVLQAVEDGLRFDVALIDYELTAGSGAALNGLDLLRLMRARRPEVRALLVTAGLQPGELQEMLRRESAGIFLKTEPTSELLLAIRRTMAGERWISSRAALSLIAADGVKKEAGGREAGAFTVRELQILRGVLEGLSNKEIGTRLELTESSVKAVLQKVFEKTGLRSRSQLVRYAIENQMDLG